MDAFIEKTGKKVNMKFKGSVNSLLSRLRVNPETVIVIRAGILITEEDTIKDKDSIKIMSVISGG